MTEDTDSKSEMSPEELGDVAGGGVAKVVKDAFDAANKAAEAAKAEKLKELIRSSGGSLGPSAPTDSFKPL